ncbi:T9SS type A sorting domain-containing protein [bacterium SCSIO 12741]|nr:T9SS type A sorting domain-containing protein [bacterium SCSIO 12741]
MKLISLPFKIAPFGGLVFLMGALLLGQSIQAQNNLPTILSYRTITKANCVGQGATVEIILSDTLDPNIYGGVYVANMGAYSYNHSWANSYNVWTHKHMVAGINVYPDYPFLDVYACPVLGGCSSPPNWNLFLGTIKVDTEVLRIEQNQTLEYDVCACGDPVTIGADWPGVPPYYKKSLVDGQQAGMNWFAVNPINHLSGTTPINCPDHYAYALFDSRGCPIFSSSTVVSGQGPHGSFSTSYMHAATWIKSSPGKPALQKNAYHYICPGDSVQLFSKYFYSDTILLDTSSSNQVICRDTVTNHHVIVRTQDTTYLSFTKCAQGVYTFPDGDTSSIATVDTSTLSNQFGCDSLIITDLKLDTVTYTHRLAYICEGNTYTFPDGDTSITDVVDTSIIHNSTSCDTLLITDLRVIKPDTNYFSVTACYGQPYLLPNGDTAKKGGLDTTLLTNQFGCDSLVILDINIDTPRYQVDTVSVCQGTVYYFADGDSSDTAIRDTSWFQTKQGCDSLLIIELTYRSDSARNVMVTQSICQGKVFAFPDSSLTVSAKSNTSVLTSSKGCDSTVTTNLSVKPSSIPKSSLAYVGRNEFNVPGSAQKLEVSLESTSDGNLIQAGSKVYFERNGNSNDHVLKGQSAKSLSGYVIKRDKAGKILWKRTFEGTGSSKGNIEVLDITLADNDDIIMTGTFKDSVDFDLGTAVNWGYSLRTSSFLARYTKDGNLKWLVYEKNKLSGTTARVARIHCDTKGNIYLAGRILYAPVNLDFATSTALVNRVGTKSDLFISKYDPVGNFEWAKQLICSYDAGVEDFEIDTAGNPYLLGINSGTIDLDPSTNQYVLGPSSYYSFIARYDTAGNFIWGGKYDAQSMSMEVNASGEVFVAGIARDFSLDLDIGSGTHTLDASKSRRFVAKLNPNATPIIVRQFDGKSYFADHVEIKREKISNRLFLWARYVRGFEIDLDPGPGVDNTFDFSEGHVIMALDNKLNYQYASQIAFPGSTYLPYKQMLPTLSSVHLYMNIDGKNVDLDPGAGREVASNCPHSVLLHLSQTYSGDFNRVLHCGPGYYVFPDGDSSSVSTLDTSFFQSVNGCDSLVLTELTVEYKVNEVYETVCSSSGTYYFPDLDTATVSKVDTSILKSVNNCDSLIITNLTVIPNPPQTVLYDTICNGLFFIFPDGDTGWSTTTDTSHLNSNGFCDSLVVTHLYERPLTWMASLDTICSGNYFYFPDGDSSNVATVDTAAVTDSLGCSANWVTTLSILPAPRDTVVDSICQGAPYYFPDGSSSYRATTQTSTIKTIKGCDSIVVTQLSIIPPTPMVVFDTVCLGGSYQFADGRSITPTGPLSDTTTLLLGQACDSVIIVNLFVTHPPVIHKNDTLCHGKTYTFPNGSQSDTSKTDTSLVTNLQGCLDTLVTHFISLPPVYHYTRDSICRGTSYTFPSGKVSSVAVRDTLAQQNMGCVEYLIIDLSVYLADSTFLADTICYGDSYVFPDGTIGTNTASKKFILKSILGCDSVVQVELRRIVPDSSVKQTSSELEALGVGKYRWIDCATNLPIPGETGKTFKPQANGSYALVVDRFGCTDTSSCYTFTNVGIGEEAKPGGVKIYPNPTQGRFVLEVPEGIQSFDMVILDSQGKEVMRKDKVDEKTLSMDLSTFESGTYHIRVSWGGRIEHFQLVKEN